MINYGCVSAQADGLSWRKDPNLIRTDIGRPLNDLKTRFTDVDLSGVLSDSNDAVTVLNMVGKILGWNKGPQRSWVFTRAP